MPSLRKFPVKRLAAGTGTIGGFLFENRYADIPRTLFHEIEIPLDPFLLEDAQGKKRRTKTALRLDFIELPDEPFRGYQALVGRTFEFPANPEPGHIDGSIYLFEVHNPIDVAELAFVARRRGLFEVTITLAIDFESEETGYANTDALAADVVLRPKAIRIDDEIVKKAKRRSPRDLLSGFVDAAILGDPVTEGGRVTVPLREPSKRRSRS
jgi:hypothetical protein